MMKDVAEKTGHVRSAPMIPGSAIKPRNVFAVCDARMRNDVAALRVLVFTHVPPIPFSGPPPIPGTAAPPNSVDFFAEI